MLKRDKTVTSLANSMIVLKVSRALESLFLRRRVKF